MASHVTEFIVNGLQCKEIYNINELQNMEGQADISINISFLADYWNGLFTFLYFFLPLVCVFFLVDVLHLCPKPIHSIGSYYFGTGDSIHRLFQIFLQNTFRLGYVYLDFSISLVLSVRNKLNGAVLPEPESVYIRAEIPDVMCPVSRSWYDWFRA